jgi:hypothetical protein
MANQITAQIVFNFFYDGNNNSISVDTRKGSVFYITPNGYYMHPLFSTISTSVLAGSVTIGVTNNSGGNFNSSISVNTTATMNNGVIDVQIPSNVGLGAGLLQVQATLLF